MYSNSKSKINKPSQEPEQEEVEIKKIVEQQFLTDTFQSIAISSKKFLPAFKARNNVVSPVKCNDDYKVNDFFDEVINSQFKKLQILNDLDKKIAFILVCHMAPTLYPYLAAITKIGRIALIIPKGLHRANAQKVIRELEQDYDDVILKLGDHSSGEDPFDGCKKDPDLYKKHVVNSGIDIINKYIQEGEKFIIIDIGGYFSKFYEDFIKETFSLEGNKKFLGIVEDTENGHQKYKQVLERLIGHDVTVPLYSVARSQLKDTEDYNVGKSIVESTVTIQRTQAHTILNRMNIAGVIGFGKIGKSIAEHLRQKNLKEVIIYDTDIIRQFEASSLGFKTVSRPDLIRTSEIIFSATGKKCLKKEDLYYLQDNVFIASCTSKEDEFDSTFLQALSLIPEERSKTFDNIHKIIIYGKRLNFLDDGNAINFIHGAVNGPYIYSVQAGLLVSALNIIKSREEESRLQQIKDLNTITLEEMQDIALIWQRHFDKCDTKIDIHVEQFVVDFRAGRLGIERQDKFIDLVEYLQKSNYFVNQRLENIITHIQKILSNFNQNRYRLDIVLCDIYENIKAYEFCYLMSYLCDLLITELDFIFNANIYENGFANIKLELSILRAWSDKITDISSHNEKFLRTASFNDLLLIINMFSELQGQISISEKATKYLEELIKDCQERSSGVHKPFMDIVKNIEIIYNTNMQRPLKENKCRLLPQQEI